MYETAFSKTRDIRQWMALMVVKKKQIMWKVLFESFEAIVLWCWGGGESRQSLADSLGWGDGAESLERPKCLVFPGQKTGWESHTWNSGDLLKYLPVHVYKENSLRPGTNHLRGLEGTVAALTLGQESCLVLTRGQEQCLFLLPVWKTLYFKRNWIEYSEGPCLSSEE